MLKPLTGLFFTLSFFLASCDRVEPIHTIVGFAQGTTYSIKFWQPEFEPDNIHEIQRLVDDEIARIDQLISNYRDDSVIAAFNQMKIANRPIQLDAEILALLDKAEQVYQQSNGCYDPTIKPLFDLWGFKDKTLAIPPEKTLTHTLDAIGFDRFIRQGDTFTKPHPQMTIDLSAIGQGYAIEQLATLLSQQNIHNYLIEIGGEMLISGAKPDSKPWRIGIERPAPNSQTFDEVIELVGTGPLAVMTSGTYRHYYDKDGKKYSHILDPRTGKPVEHDTVSVVVLLNDATYADAWSTALLCLGSEAGMTVANNANIPAIFYRLNNDNSQNNALIRLTSHAINQDNAPWRIE
ncbi:FAD:protein FMN transferase [Ostreibacterium oceani]|nr:FAD:protein FMN transferase [Ostreibacterium oceani]